MPTVQVTADDGRVTLAERVDSSNLEAEHFRACLAERIAWAAADAEEMQVLPPAPERDELPSPQEMTHAHEVIRARFS